MARKSDRDNLEALFDLTKEPHPPIDLFLHNAVRLNFSNFYKLALVNPDLEMDLMQINTEIYRANIAHWIIKLRVNPRYKHPSGRNATNFKSLSEVYATVLDACEKICTYGGGTEYENASHWFGWILYEFALCTSNATGKKAALEEIRKINSSFAKFKNNRQPELSLVEIFNQVTQIHTHRLFSVLCTKIDNPDFDVLRVKLLSSITNAMKAHTSWIDENVEAVFCRIGDKVVWIFGKGKHKRYMENTFYFPSTYRQQGF